MGKKTEVHFFHLEKKINLFCMVGKFMSVFRRAQKRKEDFSFLINSKGRKMSEISWHLRYYDNSYLFYVGIGTLIVSFFGTVYCCKVKSSRCIFYVTYNLQLLVDYYTWSTSTGVHRCTQRWWEWGDGILIKLKALIKNCNKIQNRVYSCGIFLRIVSLLIVFKI